MRPCSNWHATGDWDYVVVVVDLPFGGGGATLSGSCVCACQAPEDHAIELVTRADYITEHEEDNGCPYHTICEEEKK